MRAGVRSVEHGSLMDDEAIELMAAHGTYLVADVYCGDYIAERGAAEGWDPDVLRKNDETTHVQREGFARCVKAGVRIAFGTDSGMYPHGWTPGSWRTRSGSGRRRWRRSAPRPRLPPSCCGWRTSSGRSRRGRTPTSSRWPATRSTTSGCWRTCGS